MICEDNTVKPQTEWNTDRPDRTDQHGKIKIIEEDQ
jgi:hypothetical protein